MIARRFSAASVYSLLGEQQWIGCLRIQEYTSRPPMNDVGERCNSCPNELRRVIPRSNRRMTYRGGAGMPSRGFG